MLFKPYIVGHINVEITTFKITKDQIKSTLYVRNPFNYKIII